MPVPKVLLSVPHRHQQSDGDCLAACAAMVLAHLGHAIDYAQLLRLLQIKPHGAPAGNIRLLHAPTAHQFDRAICQKTRTWNQACSNRYAQDRIRIIKVRPRQHQIA